MARKARVEFDGAVYHVLKRGDWREAIFRDDLNRQRFLGTLGEVCTRTGWRLHAFVLMSNALTEHIRIFHRREQRRAGRDDHC